ncbi:bifunctional hydroxymethylpyrimidine kinase/phosphomethylpyrimidine kinase [Thiofilum flexile]|uniref:bifunctional hydroxymethylpyrimidine kinase/phosphomethylpyrimidine kinase n=1 Tax=Thiofilum flexile TaxID=125627 RepID=UPI00037BA27C|nr:hydroxymethylpyrimidine/phosphomethylpyrimidine kinase [Thiofilum flexile]
MTRPVVLVLAGHDPTGGAGIQADSEALAANGCHAISVITCLTVQDTHNVKRTLPISPDIIAVQLECLLADMPIAALKIGLLGSSDLIPIVEKILLKYPSIPKVLDPVLAAGGGTSLASQQLTTQIREQLLPHITLTTPNVPELARLSALPKASSSEQAQVLLKFGCKAVLLTGTHAPTPKVIQCLYQPQQAPQQWEWERLPETYHGSGCTLASACTAFLAQGLPLEAALEQAQQYTWQTLAQAESLGGGQWIPKRI